ncbi:MAG TPA: hypothetical protein VG797_08240, partial [Phycisphaerales bacterium]|nr:hypothetical protein [Phycisphaerales bacterium]
MKRSRILPGVVLAILFAALTLPPALMNRGGTSERADEQMFHLPLIRHFAETWPNIDLVHYEAAMTPGYYLGMMVVWKATNGNESALHVVNALL